MLANWKPKCENIRKTDQKCLKNTLAVHHSNSPNDRQPNSPQTISLNLPKSSYANSNRTLSTRLKAQLTNSLELVILFTHSTRNAVFNSMKKANFVFNAGLPSIRKTLCRYKSLIRVLSRSVFSGPLCFDTLHKRN
jgi:hypothetical protein